MTALGAREMGFDFDFQGAQVVADDPFIDGDENGGMRWTFVQVTTGAAGKGQPSAKRPA